MSLAKELQAITLANKDAEYIAIKKQLEETAQKGLENALIISKKQDTIEMLRAEGLDVIREKSMQNAYKISWEK